MGCAHHITSPDVAPVPLLIHIIIDQLRHPAGGFDGQNLLHRRVRILHIQHDGAAAEQPLTKGQLHFLVHHLVQLQLILLQA